jgi:ArsR family transcriptional regulator, arsenate/arsenite/antimonite-responsive transcriptional repressor
MGPMTVVQDLAPICAEPLAADAADRLAKLLKALADPARLRIVSLIQAHGGEACVCDLTDELELSQPTVSHHLKILFDAGLVSREKRGVWAYYRLLPKALDSLCQVLAAPENCGCD